MQEIEKILYKAMLEIPSVGELLKLASDRESAEWKILVGWYCEVAAAEIVKLFERKVIWEDMFIAEVEDREGYAFDYVILRKGDSVIRALMPKAIKDGQRVRVIVEDIE